MWFVKGLLGCVSCYWSSAVTAWQLTATAWNTAHLRTSVGCDEGLEFSGGAVNHLTTSSLVYLPLRLPLGRPEPNSERLGFQEPAVWKMRVVGRFWVGFPFSFPKWATVVCVGSCHHGPCGFLPASSPPLLHRGPAAWRPGWSISVSPVPALLGLSVATQVWASLAAEPLRALPEITQPPLAHPSNGSSLPLPGWAAEAVSEQRASVTP